MQINFLWKREGGETNGRVTLGKCVKASGWARHVTEIDFVIWLGADNCLGFTNYQVEALIYHELCHATTGPGGEPKIAGHDLESFRSEVEHYGLWTPDIRAMAETMKGQMSLPGMT